MSLKTDNIIDKSEVTLCAPRKYVIVYKNVFLVVYYHLAAFYGLYLCFTSAKKGTLIFNYIWLIVGGYGITGGAHRLWSHKTYKAKPALEFMTMLCNCVSYQQTVLKWVRDHRLHHKYSDTDADPHNARRGFFYSHIGWLMVRKNDLVKERGKTIDISDVVNNPILQFQEKYSTPLFALGCFIIPIVIPMICFGEGLNTAWHVCILRFVVNFNASLLVNSLAHLYGNKPYDKNIMPAQNTFVSLCAGGEGFHNYHHAFPWDYRAAELGNNIFNVTTWFLDFFAYMGWAYDLKTATPEMVKKKADKYGDKTNYWGYTPWSIALMAPSVKIKDIGF